MELIGIRAEEAAPIAAHPPRQLDKRRLRLRFYVAMLVVDTLAVTIAFVLANTIRFGLPHHEQGLTLAAATLPLFWAFNSGGYLPEVLEDWRGGLARTFLALFGALGVVLFLGFYLKASTELSRLLTVIGFGTACLLLFAGRGIIGQISYKALGGAALGRVLIRDGIEVATPADVHVIDAGVMGLTERTPHPTMLDRLARALDSADEVFVACPAERRTAWAAALQGCNRQAELLIPELGGIGIIGARQFAGVPTVLISSGPMRARDRIAKRALDLAVVIPALLFVAPLMLIVAMAIRFDSPGPVLFVQRRVGQGNRLFAMFKFRSMRADAADRDGGVSAARFDRRVTRVGRFIRATSIDELPQLFNILRGEMSLVGPRPHAIGSLAGDAPFWEVDHRYHYRHACKPGLTGLAQIRGFRGATHRREDLINRLHADLEYVNGWSVRRDLLILLATVKVVVHHNAF